MRMLSARLAKLVSSLLLFVAVMALGVALACVVGSAFAATWPLLRLSPRDQRMAAISKLASDVFVLLISLRGGPDAG